MSKAYYYRAGDDSPKGPYKSIAEVRKEILAHSQETFDSSCNCLKSDPGTNWFEEIQIFELVATVKPIVRAKITIEELQK